MNEQTFNTYDIDRVNIKFPLGYSLKHIMGFSNSGTSITVLIESDDELTLDKDVKETL